jgi:hypothetical protein
MTVTEQDDLLELSSQADCSGCADRDLEIARLIEQNRQLKALPKRWLLILAGWLLMVCVPIGLMSLISNSISNDFPLVELLVSPSLIVSLIIFPIALTPIVLLIHWRSRLQKVFLCFLSTVGVFAAWRLASELLSDFDFVYVEILEYTALIPIGVFFAILPTVVMKLWKRWKFESRDHDRVGNDPSISTILIVTSLVAAGLSCFQFLDLNSFFADMSTWQKFWQLMIYLGFPAMTLGTLLVVSFYCVLRKTRPLTWVFLFVFGIFFWTVVPATTLLLSSDERVRAVDPNLDFWLMVVGPSLVGSIVNLVLGLLSAYYLRLLGYRLWTQDDGNGPRPIKTMEG